jgi:hypothetical protein
VGRTEAASPFSKPLAPKSATLELAASERRERMARSWQLSVHLPNENQESGRQPRLARRSIMKAHQMSEAAEHSEGIVAKTIEEQTAKLPSDTFLWAAGLSIAASLLLQVTGRKVESNFVGQWAPTFLILGLYNKIVKVAGSDRLSA